MNFPDAFSERSARVKLEVVDDLRDLDFSSSREVIRDHACQTQPVVLANAFLVLPIVACVR